MLISLAQWLQTLSPEFGFFRVFQYLTFRAVMAALTALLMGLVAGPIVRAGDFLRQAHRVSAGTGCASQGCRHAGDVAACATPGGSAHAALPR